MVTLDILSDPICPWCYIGKAHLDSALAAHPQAPFTLSWHPFQLNPEMPREGMDRRAYLEAKFGGKAEAATVYARIEQQAQAAGLPIDFAAMYRTPNTLDAHRLIHWAEIDGQQSAVVSGLFAAYFAEGRDIGDVEVLADIADGVGMDAAMVTRLLATEADLDTIRAREAHSREAGVNAVPTFVIAGQYAVPGAQPPEVWDRIIAEISEKMAPPGDG